ncbi:transporter substrate-binding domain-containing protein [Bosea sp. (in: a-proteobacteria)]|jgi:polar amino acid transport system substrate-binding protein|uniref:transporter substrate-binding domain-containing protein n=1 Tax=Bosea sp. (in: a-proteobacteria) TaxID=1871050 RepID=UPI002DDCCCD1|nr:transporter substrate-binding domain-containing protein [Bosea sp. (in: a-proteobacteria)]HEV2512098.1 transporter substrate-binding domain-containing protein [Bosea sp. (in: a-proteobacteria)]
MSMAFWNSMRAAVAAVGLAVACAAPAPVAAQDSTWNRVTQGGKLRVSGIPNEAPYYIKDRKTGEWSGIFIEMGRDMAKGLGVELEVVETGSWGTAVLDLQSGKTDVHFGQNPSPAKGKVMHFSNPVHINTFNTICRNVESKTWADLNKPEVRIAVDGGSAHEMITKRNAPKATITVYKTRDEVILAVVSNKADCMVMTPLLGLDAIKKNPGLGKMSVPSPVVFTDSCVATVPQADKRMMEFINVWIAYHRGMGQVRTWLTDGLANIGIDAASIPPEVQF